MDQNHYAMLDLMVYPGFYVKDGRIIKVNQGARALLIEEGRPVQELLATGQEEYAAFSGGCLYLTLDLSGILCGASVTRMEGGDCFLLDQAQQRELQAMALAARELREPLAGVMAASEDLFSYLPQADGDAQEQAARVNRGLMQLLRLIGNMSDALHYSAVPSSRQEIRDIQALFAELFDRARELAERKQLRLEFENLPERLFSLADPEQLERAVWNILSNAMKFTPEGGSLTARLSRRGKKLHLSISDSGEGLAQGVRSSLYSQYLRSPGLEDSRFGIGLGLVMIRGAAACHGGTVLIDQPEGCGTRVTLTLDVRQDPGNVLRSPVLRVDYAGERDHGLLELSDVLPPSLYLPEN